MKSSLVLSRAHALSVRARLRNVYQSSAPAPIPTYGGMNQTEGRVAQALGELGILYVAQSGVLGGSRLDFVLLDYNIVLTLARPNPLSRPVYRAGGMTLIEFPPSQVDDQLKQHLLDVIGHPVQGAIQ